MYVPSIRSAIMNYFLISSNFIHIYGRSFIFLAVIYFPEMPQESTALWQLDGADDHKEIIILDKIPV